MYAYFSKNSQKQVRNIDNIYNIHIGQEPEKDRLRKEYEVLEDIVCH